MDIANHSKGFSKRKIVAIGQECESKEDCVVVEAPLEIRLRGKSMMSLMRTPGHDVELVKGLCFAEGILKNEKEWNAIKISEESNLKKNERGNVIEIDLEPESIEARWPPRALFSSSACGVCGMTVIDGIEERVSANRSNARFDSKTLVGLPEKLRARQSLFEKTGGIHAAGLFDLEGNALVVREDVGRHNAVDKVLGWSLGKKMTMDEVVLVVSGRTSFEIIQKAAAFEVPVIVAVSAPSSLAIDVAERFRITLCGFVRKGRMNIYSHVARVD